MTSPTADGQGWRPIDEAPDDEYLLLWWPSLIHHPVVGIKYLENNLQGCWSCDGRDYNSLKPTHFQRLPAPPTGGEGE